MKSIRVLLKHPTARLSPGLGLLIMALLLLTRQGWGQIYTGKYANSVQFQYFDLTTQTWTIKTQPPGNYMYDLAYYQGKLYSFLPGYLYIYDIANNNWSRPQNSVTNHSMLVTAGNYIYYLRFNGNFGRYDPAANTWTQLAPTITWGHLTYDGGDYIYAGLWDGSSLKRYSISTDTWTTLRIPPNPTDGVAFKNGKVYIGSQTTVGFAYYNPVTKTYTSLANPPVSIVKLVNGDGNYLYATSNGSGWARYDVSTNTWTKMLGVADINMVYTGPTSTCSPTASVTVTQATCDTGGGVNANAALTLTSYGGSVTKVGYSVGSSYTGPVFANATAVTTAPMILSNMLANPVSDQPYTIRVFADTTCYQDYRVTLSPNVCLTADLSLTASSLTSSGAKDEQLTYTFTLTNAGPNAAPNVTACIPLPGNTQFLSAKTSQGSYNSGTTIWDLGTVAVGSQTIVLTLQVK